MFILYKLILFTYLLKYYIDFTSYKLGIFNSIRHLVSFIDFCRNHHYSLLYRLKAP